MKGGGGMSVKILIKRKFKEDVLKNVSGMLIEARKNAMGSKGYISTETLVNYDDPQSVLVVSMWQSKEDWENYKYSAARRAREEKWSEVLEFPTEYEIYKMGLS